MKTKDIKRVSESRGIERAPVPSSEVLLDAAVEQTFPASDPIAVTDAFRAAREREEAELR